MKLDSFLALIEKRLASHYNKVKIYKVKEKMFAVPDEKLSEFDVILICRDYLTNRNSGISRHYSDLFKGLKASGLNPLVICEYRTGFWRLEGVDIKAITPVKHGPVDESLPSIPRLWVNSVFKEVYGFPNIPLIVPIVGAQNVLCSYLKSEHKAIVTLHSPYSMSNKNSREFKLGLAQREALQDAKLIIGNSNSITDYLCGSLKNSKIIVKHGFDVPKIPIVKNNTIVWVGFPSKRKGISDLIRIISTWDVPFQLHVVCQRNLFSPSYIRLLAVAMRKGVKLESDVSDEKLYLLLSQARAILSTSNFESFGLTVVEAANYSTPLIGLRCVGLEETIPLEKGATFFDQIDELMDYLRGVKLEALLANGEKSRKYVRENYSLSNMTKEYVKILLKF